MSDEDFTPKKLPDGSVVISPKQVKIHTATEGLSVVIGAPLMLWAATRDRKLNKGEKLGLIGLGLGAIAVDSFLYHRFKSAEEE